MVAAKPVVLTQEDTNTAYGNPVPLKIVGDIPEGAITVALGDFFEGITGYDAGETQTLKSVSGVLTWVTDTP